MAIWWNVASLFRRKAARRRAEGTLFDHLRIVMDTALDAVVSMDAAGRVTYWNQRAEAIFGWSSAEAVGVELAELVMPDRYREKHRQGMRRFLSTGQARILNRRIELSALRRDRTEFPIELSVVALPQDGTYSFNAFVADITERKLAERALQKSERDKASLLRLSKQLEQAHTYSAVLRAALAEVETVLGYRNVWAFLLAPDGVTASLVTIEGEQSDSVREQFPVLTVKGDAFLEAIFASRGPVVVDDARTDPRTNKEIVAALQNRTIVNVPMSLADRKIGAIGTGSFGAEGVMVPDPDQLSYFSTMASHIAVAFDRIHLLEERVRAAKQTEQKILALNAELEERVRRRTAQLEAANTELEAFSYSVSHDLRAPLRHIDGFAKILVEDHAERLDEDVQRYLSIIREGARSMGHMVDDLLHLSRIDRQDLVWTRTDLNDILGHVIGELKESGVDRSIDWRLGALPIVACDPGLIRIVLTNLLSNAAKYTRHRQPAVIEVGQIADEHQWPIIFVKDNGAGFDQRYAHKLFGVFQRLHRKEEFEGTGVGLATVQRIVRKHGGRIWAEAAVDAGATFFFTLGEPGPREA